MALPPKQLKQKTDRCVDSQLRIAIIGAGISGICAGIRLKQANIDNFIILEKADRIGGTWRDNTYPGAACDIPSHLYSFSFAPKGNWSRKYPTQPEILSYLEDCVRNFEIVSHIRFGAEVAACHYQEMGAKWMILLADGEEIEANVLISGCGQLHRVMIPDIAGRQSFAGASFHSALWRHDCDLSGRSVAIIGSAASAVQIAPAIASKVRELKIFQRSPNWIMPRQDRVYSSFEQSLFDRSVLAQKLYRCFQFWTREALVPLFRSTSLTRRALTMALKAKMQRKIASLDVRNAIVPTYPVGCKRILRAPDFLRLLRQEKAIIVTEEITRITPEGIVTHDGSFHQADVIVFATGFKASEFLAPIDIRGRRGIGLGDAWSEKPQAYFGMALPDFPNFFILYGPNTSLGHNSVIFMIERQVEYVKKMLQFMQSVGADEVELRPNALNRFMRKLSRRMQRMVWAGDCQSYYKNDNGYVVGIWPYTTVRYWWAIRRLRVADYFVRILSGR